MQDSLMPSSSQRTKPLILFVHIPKTAGTTLGAILVRLYGRDHVFTCHPDPKVLGVTPQDFKQMPPEEQLQYQVMRGHFGFGIHKTFREEPSTYITVLREPVDRAVSHYYYARGLTSHYLHQKIVDENLSLQDYVTSGICLEMDNGQTRLLIEKGGYTTPFGECPPEFLEQAKQNLREHFAVVGTSERFDETLVLAQTILKWSPPVYLSWLNVGRDRMKREQVPPDVVTAIQQCNALDMELYDYVNKLLDTLIAKHVRFFQLKLFWFRTLNGLYQQFFKFSRSFPKAWQEKLDRRFFKLVWDK